MVSASELQRRPAAATNKERSSTPPSPPPGPGPKARAAASQAAADKLFKQRLKNGLLSFALLLFAAAFALPYFEKLLTPEFCPWLKGNNVPDDDALPPPPPYVAPQGFPTVPGRGCLAAIATGRQIASEGAATIGKGEVLAGEKDARTSAVGDNSKAKAKGKAKGNPSLLPSFTEDKLSAFTGEGEIPVYLAINGLVFDVTEKGKHFYGPGASYSIFGGTHYSRALVVSVPITNAARLAKRNQDLLLPSHCKTHSVKVERTHANPFPSRVSGPKAHVDGKERHE